MTFKLVFFSNLNKLYSKFVKFFFAIGLIFFLDFFLFAYEKNLFFEDYERALKQLHCLPIPEVEVSLPFYIASHNFVSENNITSSSNNYINNSKAKDINNKFVNVPTKFNNKSNSNYGNINTQNNKLSPSVRNAPLNTISSDRTIGATDKCVKNINKSIYSNIINNTNSFSFINKISSSVLKLTTKDKSKAEISSRKDKDSQQEHNSEPRSDKEVVKNNIVLDKSSKITSSKLQNNSEQKQNENTILTREIANNDRRLASDSKIVSSCIKYDAKKNEQGLDYSSNSKKTELQNANIIAINKSKENESDEIKKSNLKNSYEKVLDNSLEKASDSKKLNQNESQNTYANNLEKKEDSKDTTTLEKEDKEKTNSEKDHNDIVDDNNNNHQDENSENEEKLFEEKEKIFKQVEEFRKKGEWEKLIQTIEKDQNISDSFEGLAALVEANLKRNKIEIIRLKNYAQKLLQLDSKNYFGNYALAYYYIYSSKPDLSKAIQYMQIACKSKNATFGNKLFLYYIFIRKYQIIVLLIIGAIIYVVNAYIKKNNKRKCNLDEIVVIDTPKEHENIKKIVDNNLGGDQCSNSNETSNTNVDNLEAQNLQDLNEKNTNLNKSIVSSSNTSLYIIQNVMTKFRVILTNISKILKNFDVVKFKDKIKNLSKK